MDDFISIGEAADKLVARLRTDLGLPAQIILFTTDATTNIGTAKSPRIKRREPNRTTGRA